MFRRCRRQTCFEVYLKPEKLLVVVISRRYKSCTSLVSTINNYDTQLDITSPAIAKDLQQEVWLVKHRRFFCFTSFYLAGCLVCLLRKPVHLSWESKNFSVVAIWACTCTAKTLMLKCYVFLVLVYGVDAWTLNVYCDWKLETFKIHTVGC